MAAGGVRVSIAFDDPTLEFSPTWTDIMELSSSLVASYEINRGRQYEFDRTDTGTAHVSISDREGILDITNASGPYAGLIQPLLQIKIELWNPVLSEWQDRFRGFIEDYDYTVAPFTRQNVDGDTVGVMRLELSCVDLTAILSAIEMFPTDPITFGDPVPADKEGPIWYRALEGDTRIFQVLTNAGVDWDWSSIFSLNISMLGSAYSTGQSVMEVIDDVVDAEFPTVSNRYVDRHGLLAVHGRMAKFDPETTAGGADYWDYWRWKAGDGKAVAASPTDTAHIREFAWNQGLDKVYNVAFCTPMGLLDEITDAALQAAALAAQTAQDSGSIATYGYRSWSSENLLIDEGTSTSNTREAECKLYADYVVANYHTPRSRVKTMTFKSMHPDALGAAVNWDLLCRSDIADSIDITISHPGVENTGGFNAEPFFVEGITERVTPLNPDYAMVTLSMDVSPQSYFNEHVGLDAGH